MSDTDNSKINVKVFPGSGSAASTVRFGSDFHLLMDKTAPTYKTRSLGHFILWVAAVAVANALKVCFSFDAKRRIAVIDATPEDVVRTTVRVAECSLTCSQYVSMLVNANQKKFDLDDLEEFLFDLLPYSGEETRTLYDITRSLEVEKVTTVKRQKEQNGNYNLAITRKSGKENLDPPKEVTFNVPMFVGNQGMFRASFSVWPKFAESEDGVTFTFELRNPQLEDHLELAVNEWLEEQLKEFKPYSGFIEIQRLDDGWKYKENQPKL